MDIGNLKATLDRLKTLPRETEWVGFKTAETNFDFDCGVCEGWQKVLNNIRLCRYTDYCVDGSLTFLLSLRDLSEGWYVFAYCSSKLAA